MASRSFRRERSSREEKRKGSVLGLEAEKLTGQGRLLPRRGDRRADRQLVGAARQPSSFSMVSRAVSGRRLPWKPYWRSGALRWRRPLPWMRMWRSCASAWPRIAPGLRPLRTDRRGWLARRESGLLLPKVWRTLGEARRRAGRKSLSRRVWWNMPKRPSRCSPITRAGSSCIACRDAPDA